MTGAFEKVMDRKHPGPGLRKLKVSRLLKRMRLNALSTQRACVCLPFRKSNSFLGPGSFIALERLGRKLCCWVTKESSGREGKVMREAGNLISLAKQSLYLCLQTPPTPTLTQNPPTPPHRHTHTCQVHIYIPLLHILTLWTLCLKPILL